MQVPPLDASAKYKTSELLEGDDHEKLCGEALAKISAIADDHPIKMMVPIYHMSIASVNLV